MTAAEAAPGRGDKEGKPETQNNSMIKREAELEKPNNSIKKREVSRRDRRTKCREGRMLVSGEGS